ncbi:MAG: hypothetical protein PWP23_975 [Candidatus Sumerlaeota bacterium]|nr:hypothetical protein [Candidatus Sumerlaeota bacterium]
MNRPLIKVPPAGWRPSLGTPSQKGACALALLTMSALLLVAGGAAWAGVLEPDVNLCDCRTPQGLILDPGTYGDEEPEFWIGQPVVLTYEWSGNPPPNCDFLAAHRWGDLGKCGDPQPPQGWLPYQYSGTVRTGMETSWTAEMDIGYALSCDGDHTWREDTLSKGLTFRVPQVSVSVDKQLGPVKADDEDLGCVLLGQLELRATLLDPSEDLASLPGRVFWTQQVASRQELKWDDGFHACRDQTDKWYQDGENVDFMNISGQFSLLHRDTPYIRLSDEYSEVWTNYHFTTRLVYDSGCCMVPLYSLEWRYGAHLTQQPGQTGCASWQFASHNSMPAPEDPPPLLFPDSSEFPHPGDCYDASTLVPIEEAIPNEPCPIE